MTPPWDTQRQSEGSMTPPRDIQRQSEGSTTPPRDIQPPPSGVGEHRVAAELDLALVVEAVVAVRLVRVGAQGGLLVVVQAVAVAVGSQRVVGVVRVKSS